MARRHEGKVAVVTGGTSGIGFATAKLLIDEGAHVFITGRRQAELDKAVGELGPSATGIQGDVAKVQDLDRLYAQVKKQKGSLDIVFANAGIGSFAPLSSVTEEQFDQIFGVNVRGLLFTVQKALALLRDGGAVVLNASIVAEKGLPDFSVYSASKAAVRSFARTWSVDLRQRGIRVNAVSPGIVPTPAYSNGLGLSDAQIDQFVTGALPGIPLGRPGTPEEIARAVSFLASSEASYVTGIQLFVDGGLAQI